MGPSAVAFEAAIALTIFASPCPGGLAIGAEIRSRLPAAKNKLRPEWPTARRSVWIRPAGASGPTGGGAKARSRRGLRVGPAPRGFKAPLGLAAADVSAGAKGRLIDLGSRALVNRFVLGALTSTRSTATAVGTGAMAAGTFATLVGG